MRHAFPRRLPTTLLCSALPVCLLLVACQADGSEGAAAGADVRLERARSLALAAHDAKGAARTAGYERAAALLSELLAERPDDAEALRWRAHCFTALERPSEALADLDIALRLEPRVAWAHYARAMALHSLGRDTAAIASYTGALACAPDALVERKALQWRGFTKSRTGDHAGAVEDLSKALALAPGEAWTHVARAKAYLGLGRLDDAEQDLYKAHEIAAEDTDALAQLGYLRAVRGETTPATALLRRAAEKDPVAHAETRLWLALLDPGRAPELLAGLDTGWPAAVAAFLRGKSDAAALRAAATASAGEDRRVEVEFWIGVQALQAGQAAGAQQAFAAARALEARERWEWWLAERYLALAEQAARR